ncbi:cyclophilin-like fold protein [Bacillus sp. 1P06AnD]|uniref:cyclophilin-like fold protein n=1 Tax=Bacillus sp. 1P06AnD TaxID=3132208 RepID=UPI0039A0E782
MESLKNQPKDQTIATHSSLSDDSENSKVDKNLISEEMNNYELVILGKSYKLSLENNESVSELIKLFPLAIEMQELNGNEKYYYLPKDLPTNSEQVTEIKKGDIMLFGSNCLVLFYENFKTTYSYTRLGRIVDFEQVATHLGHESLQVKLQAINNNRGEMENGN